jgi:hypothetical protein
MTEADHPSPLFENHTMFYKNFVHEFRKNTFKTLAAFTFKEDYFDERENPARNDNRIFVDTHGKQIRLMLFGEITHSSLGTQLDCKGITT